MFFWGDALVYYMLPTYTKKICIVYMKFKFNWTSWILSGNLTPVSIDYKYLGEKKKKTGKYNHRYNTFLEVLVIAVYIQIKR